MLSNHRKTHKIENRGLGEEAAGIFLLQERFECLAPLIPNLIWRSILERKAAAPFLLICGREFSPPKKFIVFPMSPSNTGARFTGMLRDSGSKCVRLWPPWSNATWPQSA